ncbi:MAG: class I SAM-dependent methyltransferase [Chloroflexota bacterium]|nr:MAG: class I SAM-dependent methyltransferase [Chloroflexota bacterium]
MTEQVRRTQMEQLYPALLDAHLEGNYQILDQSLRPRPIGMLVDIAGQTGIGPDSWVLDVGCGRGDHARSLARRHGCQVLGLDLATSNLTRAETIAREEGLQAQVLFGQADVESLPLADGAVDLVFCRDMLLHVPNLEKGLAECGRVLKLGGRMIVLATLAGDLLSQEEAEALFTPLGIVSRNLSRQTLESAYGAAGLTIGAAEVIGGERLEHIEEEYGFYSRELLRLSRMRRKPERYLPHLGRRRYELALALYTLSIYLLIGKLLDIVYWLEK